MSGATVGEAGEQYRLMCTVTTVDHLTPTAILSVDWSGGSVGTSGVSQIGMTSGVGSFLVFNPLKTSHGGNYKCHGEIIISSINLTVRNTTDRDVMVQSESVVFEDLLVVVLSFSPQTISGGVCCGDSVCVWHHSLPLLHNNPISCGHPLHCPFKLDHS